VEPRSLLVERIGSTDRQDRIVMPAKKGMEVIIKGIVQGVGFRPFIYNLAKRHHLCGWVLNDTKGVSINVEGDDSSIMEFLAAVESKPPAQAVIFSLESREINSVGYEDFEIRKSENRDERFVPISPEIATCQDCVSELLDPKDRRHRYPFINCTNCGPRFTIVKDIPYDRKFTTMAPFVMCPQCQSEYDDPGNRRFHAQPNACPVCGPSLRLLDSAGLEIKVADVLAETCRLLKEGKILAIKGLGGYHLACDAMNQDAVRNLRARKFREYKPFALMVDSIETARRVCEVNDEEARLLSGSIRPILLLRKRPDGPVAGEIAPNQKFHGIMLPYTPLHHVILAESGLVLVMTSGNISSEPIVYQDREGMVRLKGIADYYVLHDREIYIRTDDSVARVWRGEGSVLRRSRGYVPFPLHLSSEFSGQILACGAELKNAFCLTRGDLAFMSHHIGDLENLETLTSFETGIEHFKRIFNIQPTAVAYDLHPEYLSTKYALDLKDLPKVGVQHHHAHIASCMGDNGIDGDVIGVSFDGTGYGTDGKIWGGEFLVCNDAGFQRSAHFEYMPLPGGEKAIKEPWRMGASYLNRVFGENMHELGIPFVRQLDRNRWTMVKRMIENGINSPMTSSAGRFFDAVSALLGVRNEVYYEGQAAIELEMLAGADDGVYSFDLQNTGDTQVILAEPLIRAIVSDLESGTPPAAAAARFHNTMSEIILAVCLRIRKTTGLDRVALSGGVFQNMRLLDRTFDLLERNGFKVFTHHRVPTNDGGIALGQAIIASASLR
jgi:hydrogenase maturation protein HypF